MDWVKLSTRYYDDPKVIAAGPEAEVLFTRALAYCGAHETDGVILDAALGRLMRRGARKAAERLVSVGLWCVIPGGWVIVSWADWQTTAERIQADRAAARERQRRSRDRKKNDGHGVSRVTHGVTHAEVTVAEVEEEVEEEAAAAAAAREDADNAAAAAVIADDIPTPLAIFRSRFQSVAALQTIRFDQLRPEQLDQLADLIAMHGDQKLIDIAIRTLRVPPPVSVSAFLGTWAALPAPGQRLAVVKDARCTLPGHQGTTRHCKECASEAHAGGLK